MDPSRSGNFPRRRLILPFLLALSLIALPAPPAMAAHDTNQPASEAASPAEYGSDFSPIDPNTPDLDYVWQNSYTAGDVSYSGFLRLRARPGFVWQEGYFKNGRWTPPHWVPTRNRVDFIWVRGHRGEDGYWIFGHWRRPQSPGFVWAGRRFVNGVFIAGHWKPGKTNKRQIWVRGYPAPSGEWTPGFWRPKVYTGFVWSAGRFRYGRWMSGHWAPVKHRIGYVWAPGYFRPNKFWVKGHWRRSRRTGHYWRRSRWSRGVWRPGGWIAGRRPHLTRRYRAQVRTKIRRHERKDRRRRREHKESER